MSENNKSKDKQSYGLRVFNATHFYNNKPSNQLQVHSTKPFLKDGKWITSGSVRLTMTKFNGQEKQYNSIKLTYAEACELHKRLGFALLNSFKAEINLDEENVF